MFGFNADELRVLRKLSTPIKIQDFLETIPTNREPEGDTCLSPRRVLRERRAHCIEGAMLASAALLVAGEKPYLLDLVSTKNDFDHVVVLYKKHGHWGAISKTNHAVLRFRDPVYKTVRELAMSYFHEYFMNDGKKTLRTFSKPFDISKLNNRGWMTSEEDVWYVPENLDASPHAEILQPQILRGLRKADAIEIEVGKIEQWK